MVRVFNSHITRRGRPLLAVDIRMTCHFMASTVFSQDRSGLRHGLVILVPIVMLELRQDFLWRHIKVIHVEVAIDFPKIVHKDIQVVGKDAC